MTAWQLIRTHIAADSSVTSIATGGIYPVRAKQITKGSPIPNQVVGRQVGTNHDEAMDALAMRVDALEIGCIASDYDDAVALSEAVETSLRAMEKQTVGGRRVERVTIAGLSDDDNPELKIFGRLMQVEIAYQP